MNKKYLKPVFVLVVFGLISAFTPALAANQPGLKAGFQSIEGAKLGIFYAIDIGKALQLEPGVFYSLRNYRVAAPDWYDLPDEKVYDTVRFIEIPVLLKYKFNLKGPFRPFLFSGGYLGFRISEELVSDSMKFGGSLRRYSDVDSGIIVGAGFEHGRGRAKLIMDIRANFGIGRVQKVKNGFLLSSVIPSWMESKNRSFSIMVGMSF